MRHLVELFDLSPADIEQIFALARDMKTKLAAGVREPILAGRVLALLFEKPSLRTRCSFEAGMTHLGGSTQFLGKDVGLGQRESMADFARVLSQYVDVIACRAMSHQTVVSLAQHATCPVINALTDMAHPCQALADLFTLQEVCGKLKGEKLAYVGDSNNVLRSLAIACAKLGVTLNVASPEGYELDDAFLQRIHEQAPGAKIERLRDPLKAVRGACGIYTDVWTSMGQEAETQQRLKDFAGYQVNETLMAAAGKKAVFLHCLPARRGEEVTDAVMDSPQSFVVQQAGNRMHVQKGILVWLLQGAK
jgi:ornithine carbamoyltransferase